MTNHKQNPNANHRMALADPQVLSNLGVQLAGQGKLHEAVAAFRQAAALRPGDANLLSNLGNALRDLGRLEEATSFLRIAIGLDPVNAGAHHNLGLALEAQGKLCEAVVSFRRLLEIDPLHVEAHAWFGRISARMGRTDEALISLRQALNLKPDHAEAHITIGVVLARQGKVQEAIDHFQHALKSRHHVVAANNMGTALKERGEIDEAIACYRRALEGKPDYPGAHSNLLYTLQYRPGVTPAELAQAHAEFDRLHACEKTGTGSDSSAQINDQPVAHPAAPVHSNAPDPERRLRLGFLSPDFGRHPVGFFLIRVLENLDRRQCDLVCYSDRCVIDDMTTRFRAAATTWREVWSQDDDHLAEQIRADRIDILFDLAGHTAGNRLLVFARKPAPIQVTWIGYEGTTGLGAMDYLIADRWEIPEGTEPHYREKVLRLPDGYVCYEPPARAPAVGPLPAQANGHITFGSFNNPAKLNPAVIAVWAKVLHRVPGSRLILKYRGLNDASTRSRYEKLFADQSVDPGRLELHASSPYTDMLAEYNRIDLALDPFPFSGGATTCDALWMGVPVITCPGQTFAGRHSLSHLSNIGLTDTIAKDHTHYVELAAELSQDLPRLARHRAELRDRVARSPLCDGPRFAANLLTALRAIWRQDAAPADSSLRAR